MRFNTRRFVLPAVFAFCLAGVGLAVAEPKAVIIGFDGADAQLVEQWMDEGRLPNLDALRREGTFAPLQPTNPPQTPVSWSAFATGTRPGKTEIFDFIKRTPENYLPEFAMMRETKRDFLFGERNGLFLGLIVGGAALVAFFVLLLKLKLPVRVAVALFLAGAAGVGAGRIGASYLPQEVPHAINNRQGKTMWQLADEAGLEVQVLRVPNTFPAEPLDEGTMVSGLGVPDMRGRVGTPAFYTSDPTSRAADDNEFSLEFIRLPARRGVIETEILGPKNKPFYDFALRRAVDAAAEDEVDEVQARVRRELDDAGIKPQLDIPLRLEVTESTATLSLAGQTQTLSVGDWSEWFELPFAVNGVVDRVAPLKGVTRFKLLQLEPELELYHGPINFHPDCHPVAHSWPPKFSEKLENRFGVYKTIGWALDTWSLPSGVGDEELFLEDMRFTVDKYEEMMEGLLGEGDADLYVQIFYFPDRVGHLFWRYIDPGHPLYDAEMAKKYGGEILASYERMDELVGKARELAGPDALFMVISDHGFSSFRRGINYNNWLKEQGFLTLKNEPTGPATLEKLFDTKDLFGDVDWSRTKAYALGLGSIYVNLVGREAQGIVMPGAEYRDVIRQIREGLESYEDEATGQKPVSRVMTREEMYGDDFDPNLIPDLRVNNSLNYRVSWQTSLGGFDESIVQDNHKPWSGDHCSLDPDLVRGIFFVNRAIDTDAPRMIDIMPSVLSSLGVEVPEEVDGRPLFEP